MQTDNFLAGSHAPRSRAEPNGAVSVELVEIVCEPTRTAPSPAIAIAVAPARRCRLRRAFEVVIRIVVIAVRSVGVGVVGPSSSTAIAEDCVWIVVVPPAGLMVSADLVDVPTSVAGGRV